MNPPKSYPVKRKLGVGRLREKDIQELEAILYGEISNRAPDKQRLESRTIVGTVLNRMGEKGVPMLDILQEPNQYQAYQENEYNQYKKGNRNPRRAQVVKEIINEIKKGDLSNPQYDAYGAFYYKHNPDGSIRVDDNRPLLKGGTMKRQFTPTGLFVNNGY